MTLRTLTVILAGALLLAGAPAAVAQVDTGSADFSSFVAVGDSLAAGFVSGSLVETAQRESIPALVYRQATGATLEQPLVSLPGIPSLLVLRDLAPLTIAPLGGNGQPINLNFPGIYGNLSVPGFTVGDALRNRGSNVLAQIILRTGNTQLELALAKSPTFALVWLGSNDVLGAATSGRVIEGVTLTPVAQFEADYTTLVGALSGAGADLVLATLPDVTLIPFVSTLPPVVVNPATNQPVLGPGGQPIPILGPGGVPLAPNDRVLLTAAGPLAQGIGIPAALGGTGVGLGDEFVLSAGEVAAIQARVEAFNTIIRAAAAATGAALVEVNDLLHEASGPGVFYGGIRFTSEFLLGGVFSLDGVHPSPLGYAVLANEFIEAINGTYGAEIPPVDLFPFVFGSEASPLPTAAASSGVVFSPQAVDQLLGVLLGGGAPALPPERPGRGGGDGAPGDGPAGEGGGPGAGDGGPAPDGPVVPAGARPGRGGR